MNASAKLTVFILLLAGGVAQADIYKWTDANGRTHFGDKEPARTTTTEAPFSSRIITPEKPAVTRIEILIEDDSNVLDDGARLLVETGVLRIFEIYSGLFHLNMRRPVTVSIHLFETHAGMASWVAGIDSNIQQLPAGVLGLYLPKHNLVGAWRHSDNPQKIIATLLHESSHVLMSQLAPNAPAWLQEGLAQYFEGLDPAADGYVIHPAPDAEFAVNTWIARKQLVTLKQYFSLDESRWRHLAHVERNPIPYAVAWSVCYFMMGKPVGRQIINDLLQDMEKTRRPPTTDAIEKRYPGGYALMEYEWFKWAQGEKPEQVLVW